MQILGWLLILPILLFIMLPLGTITLRGTPSQIMYYLRIPAVWQSIRLSLETSILAVVVTILLGTPAAYLLAAKEFRGKQLVDTILDLPTVLPPSVAGVALLMTFGRRGVFAGVLSALELQIAFTPLAVIMAQVFVSSPYYIKSAMTGFAGVDMEIAQAAQLDGANAWSVFRRITIPLSRRAILNGVVLSWARALGEFGATLIFAGNFPGRTQTMPLAIYLGFEQDVNIALTLSLILIALSFAVLVLLKTLLHRNDGEY